MAKSSLKNLPQILLQCNTEEEIKSEFVKAFGYKLDTRKRMDLYTTQILFEFKFAKNFQNIDLRARFIAQTMYYIRELKFGRTSLTIPPFICIVNKSQAFIVKTSEFKKIYGGSGKEFDWDRAPSTPCPYLVAAVKSHSITESAHIYEFIIPEDFDNFIAVLRKYDQEQLTLDFSELDKKQITQNNFDSAYSLWREMFGSYVENGRKMSEYFLTDIQVGKSQVLRDTHEVAFDVGNNMLVRKPLPLDKYNFFWSTYERCADLKMVHAIWQKVDRLSVEDFRRFTGEFYTPIEFASKAIDYLSRVAGDKWWESGYRLWDMASGTGNLEYFLPEEALPFCYISTLLQDDVDYCSHLYPEATVFQYDYLNDDVNLMHHSGLDLFEAGVEPKMPAKLFQELNDPTIKWIIFINPPFATSNVGTRDSSVKKDSVSMTNVRKLMAKELLGETSRELFSQFLWRISKDFAGKTAYLGMFSKIKYINSNNDQKMRESFFRYRFESGFCFPAKAFHGNKGKFPVGFLVWNLSINIPLIEQTITLDVFNESVQKEGIKEVPSVDRTDALSKWVARPTTSRILPPLTNAISVANSHVDVRDKVAEGFLFSLMAKGNEFANQNATALLSGPYVSAGAFSVIEGNFEKSMIVHTVRRLPKATWLNDRDQWMQPTTENFDINFVNDCVLWSLFSASNGTASLSEVKYKGKNYEIHNELFPFSISEIRTWRCTLSSVQNSLLDAQKNRFVSEWVENRTLSLEAEKVLEAGRNVYKFFFEVSASLPWPQFKIKRWDVGWYQVRGALVAAGLGESVLAAVADAHEKLGVVLLPKIREYGFIQGAEYRFEEEFFENLS